MRNQEEAQQLTSQGTCFSSCSSRLLSAFSAAIAWSGCPWIPLRFDSGRRGVPGRQEQRSATDTVFQGMGVRFGYEQNKFSNSLDRTEAANAFVRGVPEEEEEEQGEDDGEGELDEAEGEG